MPDELSWYLHHEGETWSDDTPTIGGAAFTLNGMDSD